ncbi:MAG: co-chaperone GroES [Candidatus Woesearchaeota archaeon]
MGLIPIGERVILEKRQEKEQRTESGIIIPADADEERKEGVVYEVGNYKDGGKLPIKRGDVVLYGGYSAEEVNVDGKTYILVDFKDILAKIN